MEWFCAGDVNIPTRLLLLALALAAACNRYPQARSTVLINGFYPEYRPINNGGQNTYYICHVSNDDIQIIAV